MKYVIFLSLFVSSAHGSESWFCTTQSSQIQGTSVYACGVGESRLESLARTRAFQGAKDEFDQICDISIECQGKQISSEPKRTTCELKDGTYKCYRMVIFTVGPNSIQKPKYRKMIAGTPQGTATGEDNNYTIDDFFRDQANLYLRP